MTHNYQITGMSCNGCRTKVENTLNTIEGVSAVVTLEPPMADITMEKHISTKQFQTSLSAVGNYTIEDANAVKIASKNDGNKKPDLAIDKTKSLLNNGNGKYYCPMHCEGEKLYDKAGDCPVCGMDLVQQARISQKTEYTCPMHPEIIRDEPGACPICGMDLVPITASETEDNKTYKDL